MPEGIASGRFSLRCEWTGRSGIWRYLTNQTKQLNENGIDLELIRSDHYLHGILHSAHLLPDCNSGRVSLYFFLPSFGWSRNTLKSTIPFRSRLLIKEIRWITVVELVMLLHCNFYSYRPLQHFTALVRSFEKGQFPSSTYYCINVDRYL